MKLGKILTWTRQIDTNTEAFFEISFKFSQASADGAFFSKKSQKPVSVEVDSQLENLVSPAECLLAPGASARHLVGDGPGPMDRFALADRNILACGRASNCPGQTCRGANPTELVS